MSDIIIFAGPTLTQNDILSELDADVRPPVARGDVLDAAMNRPSAIGIIDGYFARVPSVWHKEILWAMSQGIHVFGAGSMGALRAAELESFGMQGVGLVFEQYKAGILTDDDEVAIVHASKEQGYRAMSEAMVNIRRTLAKAEIEGIISSGTRARFQDLLKALPYPDRSYPALFSQLDKEGSIAAGEAAALRKWLVHGRVDQKRDDAFLMIRHIADTRRAGWTAKQVNYRFSRTDAWEALLNDVIKRRRQYGDRFDADLSEQRILDELIVTRGLARVYDGALARALCLDLAQRLGIEINARAVESVIDDFRREQSLFQPSQFEEWLVTAELTDDVIAQFFEREARVRRMRDGFEMEMRSQVVDQLRSTGEFEKLKARAEKKQTLLNDRELTTVLPLRTGLSDSELWQWYFSECLGDDVPVDMESHARAQRTTVEELRRAVIREYLFVRESPTAKSTGWQACSSIETRN